MLGKTHFFVGIAAALAIQQPQAFPVLVAGTGAAAIGGVIPDIDSSSSEAHRSADEAILVSVLAVIAVIVADRVFHAGIYEKIRSDSSMERVVVGIALFLAVCAFGSRQPHRGFMHSIVALFLLTACVNIVLPAAAPYFATGFASHMVIDLLNYKGEQLLWPLRGRFCLRMCESNGFINKALMSVGIAATVLLFVTSVPAKNALGAVLAHLPG